jgi:selenocysteine lyase/cysteine desulfurase
MSTRPLPVLRDRFDIPDDVAYLNVASLSPTLRAGSAAMRAALEVRAQPWRIGSADWFTETERRRALFGRLVGGDPEGVALIPATSYGMATAAAALADRTGPGRRIVVLAEEYPSGIYTWRALARRTGAEIVTVDREPGQAWTGAVLDAIDDRAAIVSVPNVHWTDGTLVELDQVAEGARAAGAALVVDASQSAGVLPVDVATLAPDYLITVGYKWLLGPFGLAYMWVAPEHRHGEPLEHNWIVREDADDFAALVDYRDTFAPGARRFDVGARTEFELTPGATAALEQLIEWGPERIAATLALVTGEIEERVRALGCEVPGPRGPHLLGLRVPAESRELVLAALAGAGVHVGARGAGLRVAPHLHTSPADVDRLVTALERAL